MESEKELEIQMNNRPALMNIYNQDQKTGAFRYSFIRQK